MIYLIIIILLIALIVRFDLNQNTGRKTLDNRTIWFNIILVTFILLSAFGAIGGDFPSYFQEYKLTPNIGRLTKYYFDINSYYRPGWLIFFSFCKTISPHYLFFHFIHALFVNIVIFRFIKKNTQFVFFALLFYFILNYLEFNFESIRETMAISFVLLGVDYLNTKRWYFFLVFALIAVWFHESAIISLLIPILFKIQKVNFSRVIIFLVALMAVVYYANNNLNLDSYIQIFSLRNKVEKFYTTIDLNVNYSFNYWISSSAKILLPLFALFVVAKNSDNKHNFSGIIIFIIVLTTLYSFSFSKYFYRFSNYFMPFYWVILSQWMVIGFKTTKRIISIPILYVTSVLIIFFLIYNYGQFGKVEGFYEYRYSRYYPYETIITYDNENR